MQQYAIAFGHSFIFILQTLFYYTEFRQMDSMEDAADQSQMKFSQNVGVLVEGLAFGSPYAANVVDECQFCLLACT